MSDHPVDSRETRQQLIDNLSMRRSGIRWAADLDFVPITQRGPVYLAAPDHLVGAMIENELAARHLKVLIHEFHGPSGWPHIQVTGDFADVLTFLGEHYDEDVAGLTPEMIDASMAPKLRWNLDQMNLIRDNQMKAADQGVSLEELDQWVREAWESGPNNYAGDLEYELLVLAPIEDRPAFAMALGIQYGVIGDGFDRWSPSVIGGDAHFDADDEEPTV